MNIWTIGFLVIGVVLVVVSFLIPERNDGKTGVMQALEKREIEELVAGEMENIKSHVDEVVEEAVQYAMEKTERSLERLSNEKIMAVSEYSDTVLSEIHRNHEEVMFLYDMLNDKHKNLKNTVTEVNKTVKEAKEVTELAEKQKETEAVENFQKLIPDMVSVESDDIEIIDLEQNDEDGNSNEKILMLHKIGVPPVEIAQQLGLGVGEVKLVIELYQGE